MQIKRIFKITLTILIIVVLLIALFFGSVFIGVFGPLPDKSELEKISNEEASLVLSSDGSLIGKYFAENRTNINWEELPQHMVNALVATEDKRFFEHKGIDSRSYLRVFFKTILLGDRSSGGGSTITQQLVKNLYGRNYHSILSMPVSKLKEAIIASRMENVFSKEEILLLYFNSVPFGEEVYGVEAAAKRYFDKNAKNLNIQESATLVGMLKANSYYNPRTNPDHALKRRNQVLELMHQQKYLSENESDSLKKTKIELKYTNYKLDSQTAYFVYQVKKRATDIIDKINKTRGASYDINKDGLSIYTTMDIELQKITNASADRQIKKMQALLDKQLKYRNFKKKWLKKEHKELIDNDKWQEVARREVFTNEGMKTLEISKVDSIWHYYKMLNASVLAVNPNNAAVLVWRGGNNFRFLPYDLVLSKRQMASTVKPFIYAAAMENGNSPCDYLDNYQKNYEGYEEWKPENYDHSSDENIKVAMWYALSHSMNLPTVDLYFNTGHKNVADLCRRVGLDAPFEETPAMALGTIDASLYDVVKAYSAFANGGYLPDDLVMIEKITDSDDNIIYLNEDVQKEKVISSEVCEQITNMLTLAINQGTGTRIRNTYGIKADLAGKTGTAQNYSDAWFLSYTPDIVIGTWVGASSPKLHFSSGLGSGSALALPISGEIIYKIEKQNKLKNKYLSSFSLSEEITTKTECEPFREKGFLGAMKRLFNETSEMSADSTIRKNEKPQAEKKEEKGIKKFFRNLFKKKEKKK
ncbi:MAG: penicillin-binding protein [Marinilabiliales bacterium]|nr:MAG: penicillin-binding protein [Marinilabiliales bacterium]